MLGEAVVAEAQNVLMYAPLSERQGKSGILTVTNFKLSFVTTEERHREVRPQNVMHIVFRGSQSQFRLFGGICYL